MIVKIGSIICPFCKGKKSESSMRCRKCHIGITKRKNKRKAIGRISRWQQSRKAGLRNSMQSKGFSFAVYQEKLNKIRGVTIT